MLRPLPEGICSEAKLEKCLKGHTFYTSFFLCVCVFANSPVHIDLSRLYSLEF